MMTSSRQIEEADKPISNARVAAELQAIALTIHMFGLEGLSNMTAGRAYKTPENKHVST
jgi:hypothetical protein